MKVPPKNQALQQVVSRLAELLDLDPGRVHLEPKGNLWRLKAGSHTFWVGWRSRGEVGLVSAAIEQVQEEVRARGGKGLPLVAVPFMGEVGNQRCLDASVSWLDLSGNAHIAAPGLRIEVTGKPNRYKRRGRPSTAFAPKSARVARWLLLQPDLPITQRDLARATGLSEGYVSKIVARLEADGLLARVEGGAVRPGDPNVLLDAWREVYAFEKHHVLRGHVPAKSGEGLLGSLAEAFRGAGLEHAATGLAGAWLLDRFAGFRIATFYLTDPPPAALLQSLSFREDERGANVWLVVPNDEGVFHGAAELDGVRCAHPVQVYLDLLAHPERAAEAAAHLRAAHLNWSPNA